MPRCPSKERRDEDGATALRVPLEVSTIGNSGGRVRECFSAQVSAQTAGANLGTEFVRVLSFHDDGILSGTTTYLVQAVAFVHEALQAGFVDQVIG